MTNTLDLSFWVIRIHRILGYDQNFLPSSPWFLIPQDNQPELSENEAAQMFAALRRYLYADRSPRGRFLSDETISPRIGTIRRNLDKLSEDERLVLLYALRYIALRRAGHNRYWPECLDMLFDNRITLDDLRMRLAPVLTEQWQTLARISQGGLFRPKYGKRNIKWPLAHAGLLPSDKQVLEHFRREVTPQYNAEEFHQLLTDEYLDHFMQVLSEWLDRYPTLYESFYQTLTSDERGTIVAELAQHYLTDQEQHRQLPTTRLNEGEWRRAELCYDSAHHRLEMHILMQFAQSQGALFARWLGGDYAFRVDPSGLRYTLSLPLQGPDWSDTIQIHGSGEQKPVRLPRVPRQPLIFDSRTGKRLAHWQPGGSYYIFLPPKYVNTPHMDTLFVGHHDVGELGLAWDQHKLLAVQVANLALQRDDHRVRTISELNAVADELDLPTFEANWRPQVSLIGGELLQAGESPRYAANAHPQILVEGIWSEAIQLDYQKWDVSDQVFVPVAHLTLQGNNIWQRQALSYDVTENEIDGRHRLRLNGELVQEWFTTVAKPHLQQMRLAATLQIRYDGELVAHPHRSLLDTSNLVIHAWPSAELVLHGRAGSISIQQLIQIGPEGCITLSFTETMLHRLPHAPTELWVSWNGLCLSPTIMASLGIFILPDDLIAEFKTTNGHGLEILAKVQNIKPEAQIRLIALGRQPWNNQLWQTNVRLKPDGHFHTTIPAIKDHTEWLIVCAKYSNEAPTFLVAKSFTFPPSTPMRPAADPTGQTLIQWQRCAAFLDGMPLPRELRRLVQHAKIDRFLDKTDVQQLRNASWRRIDDIQAYERLQCWVEAGITVPQAFSEWLPSEPTYNSAAMTILPDDWREGRRSFEQPNGSLELRLHYPNGAHTKWGDGHLRYENDEGERKLYINSLFKMSRCAECRIVLPERMFTGHQHLSKPHTICRPRTPSYSFNPRVYLVAFFEPLALLQAFMHGLEGSLAEGTDMLSQTMWDWVDLMFPFFEQSGFGDRTLWLQGFWYAIQALVHLLTSEPSESVSNQQWQAILNYEGALLELIDHVQRM